MKSQISFTKFRWLHCKTRTLYLTFMYYPYPYSIVLAGNIHENITQFSVSRIALRTWRAATEVFAVDFNSAFLLSGARCGTARVQTCRDKLDQNETRDSLNVNVLTIFIVRNKLFDFRAYGWLVMGKLRTKKK